MPKTARQTGKNEKIIDWIVLLVLIFSLLYYLTGLNGEDDVYLITDLFLVCIRSLPWVLMWLIAASGFGWALSQLLFRAEVEGATLSWGLGIAALLFLDSACGSLGLLQSGGCVGAWILLMIGCVLCLLQFTIRFQKLLHHQMKFPNVWLMIVIMMPLTVLLVASTSAPGWLWESEFGGYDALSYHLALPQEWFRAGQSIPLSHNVYSYLPGYMEAAYYHLAILQGNDLDFVYTAQLLHAGFAVVTALQVGSLARRIFGDTYRIPAIVLTLAVPWVIVVGSLAYNELAVALCLATGLNVLTQPGKFNCRQGIALGLLSGVACGAKLTALGMVAIPLVFIFIVCYFVPGVLRFNQSENTADQDQECGTVIQFILILLVWGAISLIVLLPYLLRNWIAVGNPVFPFAGSLFGLGHWTGEQAMIFAAGHRSELPLLDRFVEGYHQFWGYGFGSNPDQSPNPDPWQPQWSYIPWLALIGIGVGLARRNLRGLTVMFGCLLLIQVIFWLGWTHIKSRFMLPAVVPVVMLTLIAGAGFGGLIKSALERSQWSRWIVQGGVFCFLLFLSAFPMAIYSYERDKHPAAAINAISVFTGDAFTDELARSDLTRQQMASLLESAPPAYGINHLLDKSSHTLCVGEATPLYFRNRVTYHTVWDRGPLSAAISQHPDEPATWLRKLVDDGYTHILLNETMLHIWQDEGWSDPLLDPVVLRDALDQHTKLLQRFQGRISLYEFPQAQPE